ncbi:MAG: hypothetical protein OSB67_08740 [Alphaproteobacteria bacterium]|jgi:hypothetical protein|nr:hypothetical protein [Alphaproteobacteria bacterium]
MITGLDKYSTTVRVHILRPMGEEDLEPHAVGHLINTAVEDALGKAFPGTAVLVSVDTPDMKYFEIDKLD